MSKNHDTLSPEERSRVMSRVKNKDTKPEMRVRRMIHAMGPVPHPPPQAPRQPRPRLPGAEAH